MTREDAFEIWLPIIKMGVKSMPECSEALDMAIKALKQEPCKDAISRQAALSHKVYTETEEGWSGYTVDADIIENLPPVTLAEKVGQWIDAEVLDKIKAEINSPNRGTCDYFIVDRIEEIIDKYKASPTGEERSE